MKKKPLFVTYITAQYIYRNEQNNSLKDFNPLFIPLWEMRKYRKYVLLLHKGVTSIHLSIVCMCKCEFMLNLTCLSIPAKPGPVSRDGVVYPSLFSGTWDLLLFTAALLTHKWTDSGHFEFISQAKVGQVQSEHPPLSGSELTKVAAVYV